MDDDLIARVFMKLEARDRFDPEERDALRQAFGQPQTCGPGEEIVAQGERPFESTAILDGFAAPLSTLESGTQQISEINIPGDFADLQSFLLRHMDHSVVALSPCTFVKVPHRELMSITPRFPHLTRMLWFSTLVDAAIHRQWIVGMGRRDAISHLAHLVCELCIRLSLVGLAEDHAFELPVNQGQLADMLGRSRSHVNANLQQLRALDLLAWTGSRVEVLNWPKLRALAEFDEAYLQLERGPL